jgi:plasmid stabilization system protein ParE
VPPYTVTVAPLATAQIGAALLWWRRNRPASRDLLANELDRALELVEHVPQAGRRTTSKLFRDVRRLLLPRSGYHLYYQVLDAQHAVHVVYFRHARRRPITWRR